MHDPFLKKSGIQAFSLALVLSVMVSGCSVVMPAESLNEAASTDEQWQSEMPAGVSQEAMNDASAGARWWQQMHDPLLQRLITMTLNNSPDMESARLTYRRAQLQAEIAGVNNLPSLSVSTGVSRAGSVDTGTRTNYSGSLQASWEVDLWGEASSEKRQAKAAIAQADELLRNARISLMARTANAYTNLRLAQENLRVARAGVDIRSESYDLARFEYQSGIGTELEVMQAKTQLDRAKAELPQYRQTQEEAINQLRALTDGELTTLLSELREQRNLPQPPVNLALNLPAEILRQRPDVKAQEYAVIQQAETVNQARKARFPSFRLSGSLTGSGDNYADVFDADSLVRSVAASLSYALFDNGVLKNNELTQEIELDTALNTYRDTILTAQQEVEDALSSLYTAQQQKASYQQAEDSATLAEQLARYQYDAGMLDFTDLLDTQSALLDARNARVQNEGTILTAWVELYRAAGGGWQTQKDTGKDSRDSTDNQPSTDQGDVSE
ncbi:MAG: hypothetical protein CMI02_08955 [Oceanospirillaceae bacterium]|nr:hypothetical protein [Oceanospirillaceae bacterium]MBT12150.1 hypothetical protein [Oceanospirillaceae bacterium]|tara:strand:+ start:35168 stop:36667 length:1500 start_codon:yes stop_codon:yes gene_type:complete